mmetsp:Transcript_21886/g.51892  ORF Transcript_21886/g.51892 Transcript_21886/m.51892 type:complete len:88 (-) Transcript_21886:60-323(-)
MDRISQIVGVAVVIQNDSGRLGQSMLVRPKLPEDTINQYGTGVQCFLLLAAAFGVPCAVQNTDLICLCLIRSGTLFGCCSLGFGCSK